MAPHGNSKQKGYGTDAVIFYGFIITPGIVWFQWL